jgi:DNA-binding MarR family transcriptional regulator
LAQRGRARRSGPARRSAKRTDTVEIVQGLRRIVKALHTYSQDVRKAYGLTGPQLWALKTLQSGRRMSTGRLAAALAVHQSSTSILIDRLEKRGLVRRLRGRLDHRFVEMELTPRGAALAADAPEPAQGRLLHALEAMPAREVRKIRHAVERLVEAMEASDVNARFFFADQ